MILFDLRMTQPMGTVKVHGGGKYGEAVFRRIVERGLKPIVIYDASKWLNPEIDMFIKENGITSYDLNAFTIDEIVEKENIKVIYSPLANHYYAKYNKCNVVSTIHGLRDFEIRADKEMILYKPFSNLINYFKFLLFSHLLKKKQSYYYAEMYNNPNFHFVTVSNHTKYSLLSYFPYFAQKDISVFYSPSTSGNYIPKSHKYHEKFYLLVSANRYYKNNLRAIKAFDRLLDEGLLKNVRIKIIGIRDFSVYRYNVRNPEAFDLLGFVDEKELAQLYYDAYCFVYPSITEGFGYPPLESMRFVLMRLYILILILQKR